MVGLGAYVMALGSQVCLADSVPRLQSGQEAPSFKSLLRNKGCINTVTQSIAQKSPCPRSPPL